MSSNGFVELADVESLDRFLAESKQPVLLFKHSHSCGVSAQAYRELTKVNRPIGMITVQKARPVSDEIERRFDLPHETPQVLIVFNGSLAWNASHSQVQAHEVEAAMQAVSSWQ